MVYNRGVMEIKHKYYRLNNGVRVLEVPMEGHRSVTALVLVKTGSRNEQAEEAGTSHVLEHMLFKGTKSYPTPLDLASAVDSMGAENNAYTGKEYTGYFVKSAAEHLEKSLNILAEMVTVPTLREEDLAREQGVIVEEIHMYEDLPIERAEEEFENLMFDGELGRLIIGSEKTVRATTSEKLRDYIARWYRGGNVLVVLSGAVPRGAKALVEDGFGGIKKGGLGDYRSRAKYGKEKSFHLKKKTEQAHFVLGVPGPALGDKRFAAGKIMQIVLGGNMSSRLFTEIREKRGLAYYVRARMERFFDAGYIGVQAGVRLDALEEAISVVRAEMMRVGETITEEEIRKAKDYYRGVMALSLEDSMGVAKFLGEQTLILDEVPDLKARMREIEAVTRQDIAKFAEEFVREDEVRICVVGPKGSRGENSQ